MITGDIVYLYEVKNYEGKYIYLDGKLYKESLEYEITNPYIQLQRAQSLLRQWLRQMGFRFTVEAFVAFVHPRFTFYTLQQDTPLLLPHMLKGYFEKISRNNKPLNNLHQKLVEKLIEMHLPKSPYNNLPEYKYDNLKKSVVCASCDKFVDKVIGQTCICDKCGHKETAVAAIIRHAEEYRRLFPNRKLTTTALQQWCDGQFTAYQIRYTLKKTLSENKFWQMDVFRLVENFSERKVLYFKILDIYMRFLLWKVGKISSRCRKPKKAAPYTLSKEQLFVILRIVLC